MAIGTPLVRCCAYSGTSRTQGPGSRSRVAGLVAPTPQRAAPPARSACAGDTACSAADSRRADRLRGCDGQVVSRGCLGGKAAESALFATIAKSAQSIYLHGVAPGRSPNRLLVEGARLPSSAGRHAKTKSRLERIGLVNERQIDAREGWDRAMGESAAARLCRFAASRGDSAKEGKKGSAASAASWIPVPVGAVCIEPCALCRREDIVLEGQSPRELRRREAAVLGEDPLEKLGRL